MSVGFCIWPHRTQAEATQARIDFDRGKAGVREAGKRGAGSEWSECARDVPYAVNPAIVDLEGEKVAARPQYAQNFRKHLVLQIPGFQVVQHKDCDCSRKSLRSKGKLRRVATHRFA